MKQEEGKKLEQQQNDFAQQVHSGQKVTFPAGVPSTSTRRIEADKIQVQCDEVKTKSQETGKKWNLTYTATIETAEGLCYYLAAANISQLILTLMTYLAMLGYLNKSLEVVSNGSAGGTDSLLVSFA
jgi:hypothetical protein